MENFIVSARKYRPATFDTVVGQKSITNTLKNAIKNQHLAQAFLFTGPRGVGKTTCARILAKTINCQNVNENIEPCNECESCTSFNESASFNIHELDAASNNSVDDIRNLVDQVRIPPQVGRYKVYIIDEVHMLSQSAFNAFLKTLEEPPAYAKFILATTEKHKVIPTILSRCQIFDFKRITIEDIVEYLAYVAKNENIEYEENVLHIIAQKADGAMRDALSIFDQIVSFTGSKVTYQDVLDNLNVLDYDYYFKMVDFFLENDITNTLLTINEILENGFDGQHFIIGLGEHLRSLLVAKDKETLKLMEISDDFRERYLTQSQKCDLRFLINAIEINNTCDLNYKSSNNKRLHLELALMQLCTLTSPLQDPEYTAKPAPKAQKKTPELKSGEKAVSSGAKKTSVAEETPASKESSGEDVSQKPTEKKARPKPYKSDLGPGTISIKEAAEEQKKEEEVKEEENLADKPADEFSLEQLQEIWKVYAIKLSEKDPVFASAMTKYPPELPEKHLIRFKADNKMIAGDHLKLNNLLAYLKQELNNYHIEIKTEVLDKPENTRAYTDREKFEQMARKNPALNKLKSELDLEIDF